MDRLDDTYLVQVPPEVQAQIRESRRRTTATLEAEGSEKRRALGEYWQRIAAREYPEPRYDQVASEAKCQSCYDVGWLVNHQVSPSHPEFGKLQPCHACGLASEQKVDELFRSANLGKLEHATLDSYPVTGLTRPILEAVREWVIQPKVPSLLLAGSYGVGKTGLAVSALRARVAMTYEAGRFVIVSELLDRLRESYNREAGEREAQIMGLVRSAPTLVLDELGTETIPTDQRGDWTRQKLFDLINHRYNREMPTIFTTNLTEGQMSKRVGERTAQRLAEMSTVLRFPPAAPNLRSPEQRP